MTVSLTKVAVDASLDLFSRAWCMAELAEAQRMGMGQCLLIRNKATLLSRQHSAQTAQTGQFSPRFVEFGRFSHISTHKGSGVPTLDCVDP